MNVWRVVKTRPTGARPVTRPAGNHLPKVIVSADNAVGTRLQFGIVPDPDDGLALAYLLTAHKMGTIELVGIASTFGNNTGEATSAVPTRLRMGATSPEISRVPLSSMTLTT